jgi:muconate cycloisomerase
LRIIRRCIGGMDLRVDANEAWTPPEAIQQIRRLAPFRLSAVEQPVAHQDFKELASVRKATGVPIMLDESLCSRSDAERADEAKACDSFNIRLSKCGGFIASLRLVQFARQRGIAYQLGCQVGETGILSAAGRHFAASVTGLAHVEGSYDRYLVSERLTRSDLTFGWGGKASALPGPGLDIEVDEEALARVTVQKDRVFG